MKKRKNIKEIVLKLAEEQSRPFPKECPNKNRLSLWLTTMEITMFHYHREVKLAGVNKVVPSPEHIKHSSVKKNVGSDQGDISEETGQKAPAKENVWKGRLRNK